MASLVTQQERKDALSTLDPDGREATMLRLRDYLAASHLSLTQFAGYIGRSKSSLDYFLGGRYHEISASDLNLRKRIDGFIDANPIGTPKVAESSAIFYETENAQAMRVWFDHTLALGKRRGRIAPVYAGPGSGKTYIAHHLVHELNREHLQAANRPRAFYVYVSQGERRLSLVVKMMHAVGLAVAAGIQGNLASLRYHLRHNRSLFIFDEGQHLSFECLEMVRELNDVGPHFGVLILGSHRLRQFFNERAAEMEQWLSRMRKSVELPGDSKPTVTSILRQELQGIVSFDGDKGGERLELLLQRCLVPDIYAHTKREYYSIRRVFDVVEDARDRAAQKGGVN